MSNSEVNAEARAKLKIMEKSERHRKRFIALGSLGASDKGEGGSSRASA
jgi:hypothetical protein